MAAPERRLDSGSGCGQRQRRSRWSAKRISSRRAPARSPARGGPHRSDRGARHPRPPPRRPRRNLLAVPPVWPAGLFDPHRLAPLRELRPPLCARARMGSRPHASGSGRTFPRRWISRATSRPVTKRDRALVLMLAAAELLVRSGERVGLLGVTLPSTSRRAHAPPCRGHRFLWRVASARVQSAEQGQPQPLLGRRSDERLPRPASS